MRFTPKMLAVTREKRKHRERPAVRLKKNRKREREKQRDIDKAFIRKQKEITWQSR